MKYKVTVEHTDYPTITFRNLMAVLNQGSYVVFAKDTEIGTGVVYSPRRGDRIYIEVEGEETGGSYQ